ALSGRPPQPRPARRSAALAAVAACVGAVCLYIGGHMAAAGGTEGPSWGNLALILAGVLALVVGLLLASPPAIRLLAAGTKWLPVAGRLALSDLSRYRARSGSALAAISLVLAIAVTIIVTTTAAQATTAAGNLSDQQLLVRYEEVELPFVPDQADVDRVRPQVDRLAAELDGASVTELTAAFDPTSRQDPKMEGRFVVSLARRHGDGWQDVSAVYVATAQLLALYGSTLDDSVSGFLSTQSGELHLLGTGPRDRPRPSDAEWPEPERVTDLAPLTQTYSSLPGTFVTPAEMRSRHFTEVQTGTWLIQTDQPLTGDQLARAREIAAGAGLTIESRDRQQGLATLRTSATAAGMLVALGILAMTVGLVRSETGRDLRILTAAGARRTTRRTITATTAGGLAVLAVLLGTAAAYLGLVAGYAFDLHTLHRIPLVELVAIAIGVPLLATAVAWLVSGREPTDLGRQPME
ncbi:MAG: ABC transporter permease, partial [Actinomycetes bacterium]